MQRLDLICFDSYLLSKSLTHHWFSSNHSVTSQNVFTVSGICKIDAAYRKSSQMFTTQHVLQKKKNRLIRKNWSILCTDTCVLGSVNLLDICFWKSSPLLKSYFPWENIWSTIPTREVCAGYLRALFSVSDPRHVLCCCYAHCYTVLQNCKHCSQDLMVSWTFQYISKGLDALQCCCFQK